MIIVLTSNYFEILNGYHCATKHFGLALHICPWKSLREQIWSACLAKMPCNAAAVMFLNFYNMSMHWTLRLGDVNDGIYDA